MRNLVRQSKKGGRCTALNQYYKSTISDEVFSFISKELDNNVIYVTIWINILNIQLNKEK